MIVNLNGSQGVGRFGAKQTKIFLPAQSAKKPSRVPLGFSITRTHIVWGGRGRSSVRIIAIC